eukprot:3495837-Rhodomonas_salina.1
MQAFARLRKLDMAQSVSFFGSLGVDQSVRMGRKEAAEREPRPEPGDAEAASDVSGWDARCTSTDVLMRSIVNTVPRSTTLWSFGPPRGRRTALSAATCGGLRGRRSAIWQRCAGRRWRRNRWARSASTRRRRRGSRWRVRCRHQPGRRSAGA